MFVDSVAAIDNGFTTVRLGGIEEQPGAMSASRRVHVLSEEAGRMLAPAMLIRDLHRPDSLIIQARTELYGSVGATVLAMTHDLVCRTYGPQPLEFELEGMPAVREADGSVRPAGELAMPLEALQPEELQLVAS